MSTHAVTRVAYFLHGYAEKWLRRKFSCQ